MLRSYKFPFTFDPVLLQNDLQTVQQVKWANHFNPAHYQGTWMGIALRGIAAEATNIVPLHGDDVVYQDTALLAECPYFQSVLETFKCPLKAVRLLQLEAGSVIKDHTDDGLEYEQGEVRIHIPIITDPDVYFYLDGERIQLDAGTCWYTDVKLLHRVENRSTVNRVHLVIDCDVNDWLRSYLENARQQSYDLLNPIHQQNQRYYSVLFSPSDFPVYELISRLSRYAPLEKGSAFHFAVQAQKYQLVWKFTESGATTSWIITIDPTPPSYVLNQLSDIVESSEHAHIDDPIGSCLVLETMPDPNKRYSALYDEVVAMLRSAMPDAAVYHAHLGALE